MRNVVIAVDGSRCSEYAVEFARDLLEPFAPLKVALVHVVPIYHLFIDGVFETDIAAQYELRQAYEERGHKILTRAAERFDGTTMEVEPILCDGDIVGEILRVAEETEADLLVVGSRGLGEVQSMFLGSVSHKLAHHAPCPVLIVKDDRANGDDEPGDGEPAE